MTQGSSKYRPDVDGLRAVAVGGVVVFHAWPNALRGGFVGVDIFFVISGFLITSLIVEENDAGTFSFARFYARRLKRLFPALLLMLAAAGAVGWHVLFGNELQQLARHTAFAAAFSANFAFWAEAGYFDVASELKVLLNLWSLGVEEQFYLVWPLALLFLRQRARDFLTVAGVASFVWSVACTWLWPAHAFFLPDARFWELLIGCGLAFASRDPRFVERVGRAANGLSALGLVLIGAGFALITRKHFPASGRCFPPSAQPR
jgi:peptidoglycan/LPS O-acetylase OafA/YrhL